MLLRVVVRVFQGGVGKRWLLVEMRRRRRRNPLRLALYVAEMWCTVCEGEVWKVFWLLKKLLRAGAEKKWTGGVEL